MADVVVMRAFEPLVVDRGSRRCHWSHESMFRAEAEQEP